MHRYRRSHLADASLLHSATTHLGLERTAMAELLADLAEIDSRKLFLTAGYPSLYAWCLGELRLSEDAAFTRIKAARAARRFPATDPPVPERVDPVGPQALRPAGDRAQVTPLSPGRYGVQFTLSQTGHDLLRSAQALIGHSLPPGDLAQVFERGLRALVRELEKAKFAATDRPRPQYRSSTQDSRSIPAQVRRAVWERNGGRCTYVSSTGKRCEARKPLEFDHVQEYARGGEATVSGIRLRCRAQPASRREHLRRRVHAPQATGGSGDARCRQGAGSKGRRGR